MSSVAAPVSRLGRLIAEVTGGVTLPLAAPADPFQALDELMAVVEVLCPVWPPRPPFINASNNRL